MTLNQRRLDCFVDSLCSLEVIILSGMTDCLHNILPLTIEKN